MWRVAVRPQWIAALILALAVAAAFAALGQWQLERSIASGAVTQQVTETVVPLDSATQPQAPVSEAAAGQLVTVSGSFVPGEFLVFSERLNEGELGYWVVGHFVADGAGLAVALGWTADEADASAVAERMDAGEEVTITGRYLPSEPPQQTDFRSGELSAVSAPALVNLWPTVDEEGVYGGFLVASGAVDGLQEIHSPPPIDEVQINWLNVFYAAEWVIFAGFAVFLWYRLVKDAWEKEIHAADKLAP